MNTDATLAAWQAQFHAAGYVEQRCGAAATAPDGEPAGTGKRPVPPTHTSDD